MISFKQAWTTVHRDSAWWRKALIGGALYLTLLGAPIAEGYQLESIDNTNRGFPTPLPRWNDLGSKAVQGLFGLLIDIAFFIFPLLAAGLVVVCSAIGLVVVGADARLARGIAIGASMLVGGWWLLMWLLSVSPIGKRMFVHEGQPGAGVSRKTLQTAWEPTARPIWLRARLHSLPPYLPALLLLAGAWRAVNYNTWLGLGLLWLALSAIFYARLITIQLYAAAASLIQRRRFEALRGRNH
jgi:hypothetical protein